MKQERTKKFIRRGEANRKVKWKASWEAFSKYLNIPIETERISGDLVHSVIIKPKKGGREGVIIRLVRYKGAEDSVPEWFYSYKNGQNILYFRDTIGKEGVEDLEPFVHKGEKYDYYPVLDLQDKHIKGLIAGLRERKSGDLAGAREAILVVPNEVFNTLKDDIVMRYHTKKLIPAIERAIKKGEIERINKEPKSILLKIANLIKKTDGKALVSLSKLSPDEMEMVMDRMKKAFGGHTRVGHSILKSMRFFIEKSVNLDDQITNPRKFEKDKDRVTKNLVEFFKKNGINIHPDQVRRAVELVIKSKAKGWVNYIKAGSKA